MKHRHKIEFSPKLLLLFLTILCGLLLTVSVFAKNVTKPFSGVVAAVVVPMQEGINSFGAWVGDHFGSFQTMRELREENEALSEKVEELTEQNAQLSGSQEELASLRELYALDAAYPDYPKVGARVISSGPGNWYENFIINKGSDDGIAVNMNVLAGTGLVGIVTEVGHNYAKVRALIDDDSRVSAMSTTTSDTCIVKGDSETVQEDGTIDVTHISKDASIQGGETLVTSNISSKYLPGLTIGTVSDVSVDSSNLTKSARVTPVVDFQHISDVLVITQLKEVPEDAESAD